MELGPANNSQLRNETVLSSVMERRSLQHSGVMDQLPLTKLAVRLVLVLIAMMGVVVPLIVGIASTRLMVDDGVGRFTGAEREAADSFWQPNNTKGLQPGRKRYH